ncbi:flagellar biosynthetic protein FliO [Paraliobacillus salinarum]|uniref:flagellar biosynthetic protein FliO n=1 Tax=Paraliobacillus salinarum TaxID=1158996 RepID=UPI0015F77E1F|nr:flagellar biosynthetic protein FliO [Paraliobacillus salinarum]
MLLIGLFLIPNTIVASSDNDNVYEWLNDDANKQDDSERNNTDNQVNKVDESKEVIIDENRSTNFFEIIVRIIFALLLIVALIYGMLKLLNKKNKLTRSSNLLNNLGGIPLGTNKSVQIIQIGDRLFVVGVGENIELLTEIKEQEMKEQLLEENDTNNSSGASVAKILGNTFSNLSNKKEKNQDEISDSFSNMFKSELNHLKQTRTKITNRYKRKEEDKNE